jgi:hypothetical protein
MDFQFDPQTYLMQMEGRIIEEVRANKKEFRTALHEQDRRIDKLESWRNYLAGRVGCDCRASGSTSSSRDSRCHRERH